MPFGSQPGGLPDLGDGPRADADDPPGDEHLERLEDLGAEAVAERRYQRGEAGDKLIHGSGPPCGYDPGASRQPQDKQAARAGPLPFAPSMEPVARTFGGESQLSLNRAGPGTSQDRVTLWYRARPVPSPQPSVPAGLLAPPQLQQVMRPADHLPLALAVRQAAPPEPVDPTAHLGLPKDRLD